MDAGTDAATVADTLLDILGSKTRRRILELLADEPHYLLQLSNELGVTMPAIHKHLEVLEGGGLVTSFEEKSDLGAPPRRYYRLDRSLYLTAGITSDFVKIETMPVASEVSKDLPKEFTELHSQMKDLREIKDSRERLEKSHLMLANVDDLVRRLNAFEVFLLSLRREARQIAKEAIRHVSETSLQRRIVHAVLGSRVPPDPELISARLEIRERTVEEVLKELERKGITLSKKAPQQ